MNEKSEQVNKALLEKDMAAYEVGRASLNSLVADYKKEAKAEKLAALASIPERIDQINEMLTKPEYTVMKITEEKNDNKIITGVLVEESTHCVTLEDAFKACNIDKGWKFKMEALNFLMTIHMIVKVANGNTDAEKKKAAKDAVKTCTDTYKINIDKVAKLFDLGETPYSRNKIVAMMQKVVDEVIYEEASADPENKPYNKYKVTSRNLDVLEALHLGGQKVKCGNDIMKLPAAKLAQFSANFMQMLRNVITGDEYVVTYKQKSEK